MLTLEDLTTGTPRCSTPSVHPRAPHPRGTAGTTPRTRPSTPQPPKPSNRCGRATRAGACPTASGACPGAVPPSPETAAQLRLPLPISTSPATVSRLQTLILKRQVAAPATARRRIGALLTGARRLDRKGEGPGPLLRWLADQTASTVTHHGSEARTTLAGHSQVLEQLATGRTDSAAVQTDGPADRRESTDTARLALVFGPSSAERPLGRGQEAARMAPMPGETEPPLPGSRRRSTTTRTSGGSLGCPLPAGDRTRTRPARRLPRPGDHLLRKEGSARQPAAVRDHPTGRRSPCHRGPCRHPPGTRAEP